MEGEIRLVESLPFKCNVCHKQFHRKISLEHHMRGHTGERPFACSYCPMRFRDGTRKRVHERVHTGERPYACHFCDKTFATSSHLKNHIRCHTGERPYHCKYPGCFKLFSTASSLSSHIRTHPPSLEPQHSNTTSIQSVVTYAGRKFTLNPSQNGVSYRLIPISIPKAETSKQTNSLNSQKEGLSYYDGDGSSSSNRAGSSAKQISNGASTLTQLTHPHLDFEIIDEQNGDQSLQDDEVPSRLIIDEDYVGNGNEPSLKTEKKSQLLFELQKPPASLLKPVKGPEYSCERCGEAFNTYSCYNKHVQDHDEKPFPCPVCGDTFNSIQELNSHREVHSAVNKKRYCPYCNKPFAYNNKSEMDQHVAEHKRIHSVRFKPDPVQANDTSTDYPHSDYLKVLRNGLSQLPESATVFKKLDCPYCSKIYIIEEDLQAHLQTHFPQPGARLKALPVKKLKPTKDKERIPAGEKPFSCSMCPLRFRLHSTLIVHERRHRNESPYTCEYCKQQFGTPEDLQTHLKVHTPAAKQHKCTLCAKKFGLVSLLRRHMVVQHKITYSPPKSTGSPQLKMKSGGLNSSIEVIPIEFPSSDATSRQEALERSVSQPTYNGQSNSGSHGSDVDIMELNVEGTVGEDGDGTIQYECPYCPRICKQKTELKAHVRSHTGERPFGCDFCGKRFTQRGHLTMHIRIHTGEKPFRCPYCLREFNQHSNLKSHMEVHKKTDVHPCTFCGQTFHCLSRIRAHMLVHSAQAALLCQLCNRQFSRKSDLLEHMGTHTNDKPFVCAFCNKRFARKTHLTIHERSHDTLNDAFETVQIKIPKRPTYSCYHCEIDFPSVQDLHSHSYEHPEAERMTVFLGNEKAKFQQTK